jgi:hypothetical protein
METYEKIDKVEKRSQDFLRLGKMVDNYLYEFWSIDNMTEKQVNYFKKWRIYIKGEYTKITESSRPSRKSSNSQLRAFMKYQCITKKGKPELYQKYINDNPWVLENDTTRGRPSKQKEMLSDLLDRFKNLKLDLIDPDKDVLDWIDSKTNEIRNRLKLIK